MGNLFADREIAKSFIESLPAGVGVWYLEPFSCVMNQGVTELTGFSDDDFQQGARLWLDRVTAQDRERLSAARKQLQREPTKVNCEYRFLPKGKKAEIWIKDTSHSFELTDGKIGGFVSVYTDISTSMRETKPVCEAQGDLRGVVRGLVHDVRNHVHAISSAVELQRMTGSSTLQSSDITNPAQAINKLVAEFLEYLFPPEGRVSKANLVSILQEVIPLLQDRMQRRGIRLDVVHRGSLPQLALDVPQVTRALEKILDFSVNILPQGGELCMETRVVEADGGDFVELRINIRSSIPLEFNEEEVFKPFARLYQYKAGLSLALARQILRRNHGAISFRKSDPRQGSISLILEVQ